MGIIFCSGGRNLFCLLAFAAHCFHLAVIRALEFIFSGEFRTILNQLNAGLALFVVLGFHTVPKLFVFYKQKHCNSQHLCRVFLWMCLLQTRALFCAAAFSSSDLSFFFWLELCLQQHFIWAKRFPFYMSWQLWRTPQWTEMLLLSEWCFYAFSCIFQRDCMSYWKY